MNTKCIQKNKINLNNIKKKQLKYKKNFSMKKIIKIQRNQSELESKLVSPIPIVKI